MQVLSGCPHAGLRQTLATFGALLGATVAGIAFKLSGQNFIATFALATIPAGVALFITSAVRCCFTGAPQCCELVSIFVASSQGRA